MIDRLPVKGDNRWVYYYYVANRPRGLRVSAKRTVADWERHRTRVHSFIKDYLGPRYEEEKARLIQELGGEEAVVARSPFHVKGTDYALVFYRENGIKLHTTRKRQGKKVNSLEELADILPQAIALSVYRLHERISGKWMYFNRITEIQEEIIRRKLPDGGDFAVCEVLVGERRLFWERKRSMWSMQCEVPQEAKVIDFREVL